MSIKTKLIDPSIYSETSSLCVFELGDYNTTYLSSMRLMNLGVHGDDLTDDDRYNSQAGILSMIKNITLFDGSVVLSQLNSANVWGSFKSVNRDNSDAFTMRHMYQDATALSVQSRIGDNLDDSAVLQNPQFPRISNYNEWLDLNGAPLETEALSAKGYVDLRVLLKGLQNIRYLPTMIFKSLRLEIIFDTSPSVVLADVTNSGAGIASCRPVLMVDCVNDMETQMEMLQSMRQVVFDEIEVERSVLNAVGGALGDRSTEQNYILKNYDNKYVKRLLIAACPTGDDVFLDDPATTVDGGGALGAMALYQANLQVVSNGSNVLPGGGLTKANEIMATCTDAWGDISTSPFSYLGGYIFCGLAEECDQTNVPDKVKQTTFLTRAYMGLRVEANVSNLQVNLSRETTAIKKLDGVRNLHVFGEVTKVLEIADDMTYNIRYI